MWVDFRCEEWKMDFKYVQLVSYNPAETFNKIYEYTIHIYRLSRLVLILTIYHMFYFLEILKVGFIHVVWDF